MPARTAGKKGAKKRATPKKAGKLRPVQISAILKARILRREWVMYAQPIMNVAASGNINAMRSAAALTRTHLADVTKSLGKLDEAIRSRGK